MSDIAIRVENLSKRYRIGEREPYKTLRDAIAKAVSSPFHRLKTRQARSKEQGVRSNQKNSLTPYSLTSNSQWIWALKDVSFEIKQGEVVGIIGRNGAGKTTLLKILSRITEPTEGYAEVRGRVGSLLEVGTGFHPELTGRENIYLNGAILGMRKKEIDRKFDEIVEFAEIEKFIDTPVKRYSSGMYVRLAFAVAAHLEPEILLVDEVLAVGDAAFQKKCLGKMGDVAKEGRTVLFVSHNMGAVRSLCERVLWLYDGSVIQSGPPVKVIAEYLSSGTRNEGEIEWASENAPGGREVRLKRVRVLDKQGNVRSSFRADEEILVEIRYKIWQTVKGMRVNLYFLTPLGEIAFASSTHTVAQEIQYPGLYVAQCTIPANLLNFGRYQIRIGAGIPGIKVLWRAVDCISFNVDRTGSQGSYYPENWPGIVCPKLDWKISRLEGL